MTAKEKVKELRSLIENSLDSYINSNYVFLDLPYHPNVGDTLIAQGAKNFLKRFKYKCLYWSSEFTFDDRYIAPQTLIIFNGGGNFGDLWQNYTVFRNSIIKKYPNNHYLILPQSVYYVEENHLKEDVELYSSCPNITICARDRQSFDFLKSHFVNNEVLLVPDMAFYSDCQNISAQANNKVLFLRRNDKEFVNNPNYDIVPDYAEVHDWPTMESEAFKYKIWYQVSRINYRVKKYISKKLAYKIQDLFWQKILLPYNVKSGLEFVNQYSIVYTTRLHVAIICVLLGKETYFFDNSYHKNYALYNTWLRDVSNIHFIN